MSFASGRLRRWTERWWSGEGGRAGWLADRVLAPAEGLYRAAAALRAAGYDRGWLAARRAPIPIISVGNLAVGGSGKTPFTAWLAGELRAAGRRPAVLLRGYGEDELLLHRELNPDVPVFAAAERLAAARAAARAGCRVALLDDGFQHRRLRRDVDLVLVAADGWLRGIRLLPRGPWREGAGALRRADAVIAVSRDPAGGGLARIAAELAGTSGRPVVQCRIVASGVLPLHGGDAPVPLARLHGQRVLAVSAIADPGSFRRNLADAGLRPELIAFPDHHPFSEPEAERLVRDAAGRPLMMTHKDAVKLRPLLPARADAWLLAQRVEIVEGSEFLEGLIGRALAGTGR